MLQGEPVCSGALEGGSTLGTFGIRDKSDLVFVRGIIREGLHCLGGFCNLSHHMMALPVIQCNYIKLQFKHTLMWSECEHSRWHWTRSKPVYPEQTPVRPRVTDSFAFAFRFLSGKFPSFTWTLRISSLVGNGILWGLGVSASDCDLGARVGISGISVRSWFQEICHSTKKTRFSKSNFSNVNKYFCMKIAEKNEPSLKTPNLQGFCLTPNSLRERSFRKKTLDSLVGVGVPGTGLGRAKWKMHAFRGPQR